MIKIRTLIIVLSVIISYHSAAGQSYMTDIQLIELSKYEFLNIYINKYETDDIDLNLDKTALYKNRAVPIFMILAGIGIAGIWAVDIASGKFSNQGHFFKWREGENMLWPHIFAEYLTSAALITGGIGLYSDKSWAINLSFAALGALAYTAINSSGWVLAEKDRIAYGIPMWVCLAGSIVSFAILLK